MANNFAILLAVDDYPATSGYPKLNSCVRDAREFASILTDSFGYSCISLYDLDCRKNNVQNLMESYLNKFSSDDKLVIFLSGHGEEDFANQTGFFIPQNGQKKTKENWICFDEIVDWCYSIPALQIFLCIDTCNSGYFLRKRVSDSGYIATGKQVYVLTSGRAGQTVSDGKGEAHSPFMQAVLDAFQGWAGIGDDIPPHRFTAPQLIQYVQRKVMELNPFYGEIPLGGYLARDVASIYDMWFEPRTPRLRPSLVSRLLHTLDPLVVTIALAEIIEYLGFSVVKPLKLNLSLSKWSGTGFQSFSDNDENSKNTGDKRLHFVVCAANRELNIIYKPYPDTKYQELAADAFIRLLKLEPSILLSKAIISQLKNTNTKMTPLVDNALIDPEGEYFTRSMAVIIINFDKIPGGIEKLRKANWKSIISDRLDKYLCTEILSDFSLFENSIDEFKTNEPWKYEIIKTYHFLKQEDNA